MTELERLKEHMRACFRTQAKELPKSFDVGLFYGGSTSLHGYVDIPVSFSEGVHPHEAYQAVHYWINPDEKCIEVNSGFGTGVVETFSYETDIDGLLAIADEIRYEVADEVEG